MEVKHENISANFAMEAEKVLTASPVDFWHGHYVMLLSMLFFHGVNSVVCRMGKPKSVKEDSWKWTNLVVSWVHALIVGVWDLSCFILYPELTDDLLYHINYFTYCMVAVSTGYFMYDFLDMLMNNKLLKLWEVTLHHLAVTSIFYFNIYKQAYIAFNCVALLAEVNSFFLHSRKLLQMLQYQFQDSFYKIVCVMNLLTFFVFRGISLVSISLSMMFWRDRVTKVYYYSLFSSMFFMNVMNPILFWRLLKNDFLRPSKSKSESKLAYGEKETVVMNGNNNVEHVNDKHLKSN
ncbi:TLC domain-containing protein 2 [Patella vulgata]|uniref:TLC domain-containing protein 2 n=1 Tax=Patella vulgata TaxID=6465 RepID=UPI0021800275|nr:TLC domain-containing protein 2 [Patella vulgata]